MVMTFSAGPLAPDRKETAENRDDGRLSSALYLSEISGKSVKKQGNYKTTAR